MAKFLTGNELYAELEKIFEKAQEQLVLISPQMQLNEHFVSVFQAKKDNHKLDLIIVIGKNESNSNPGLNEEELNFFKQFSNIQIRFEKRLNTSYYANEYAAILTSISPFNFSRNNIDTGVLTKSSLLGNVQGSFMSNIDGEQSLDRQALNYFSRVVEQSEIIFHKKPVYESAMLGLTKKYKESVVEVDKLNSVFISNQESLEK